MFVRDVFNNGLSENDQLLVAISPGNFLFGTIKKISTGLDGGPPVAVVSVEMPLPIHPASGILQGAIAINKPEVKEPESKIIT